MTMIFRDISAPTPTKESLAAAYAGINAQLDAGALPDAITTWEALRREIETWSNLTSLRFDQDTSDKAAKAALDYRDELMPTATNHEIALKRRLLALPDRVALTAITGAHAVALWETDITTFDPAIEDDLIAEAKLQSRYTELTSSARLEIEGDVVNLSGTAPYAQSLDRDVRYRAARARWQFFEENGAEFDEIYDGLVKLRHAMAQKLGFETFAPLGYRRMRRVDYDAADVARYREQVLTHVTPLVGRIMAARQAEHGWDNFYAWDEPLTDPKGNVKPAGGRKFSLRPGANHVRAHGAGACGFLSPHDLRRLSGPHHPPHQGAGRILHQFLQCRHALYFCEF
jgi:oligoendopeptidase F